MELVPHPEALPQILPLPRAVGLKKTPKIPRISTSLQGGFRGAELCRMS